MRFLRSVGHLDFEMKGGIRAERKAAAGPREHDGRLLRRVSASDLSRQCLALEGAADRLPERPAPKKGRPGWYPITTRWHQSAARHERGYRPADGEPHEPLFRSRDDRVSDLSRRLRQRSSSVRFISSKRLARPTTTSERTTQT